MCCLASLLYYGSCSAEAIPGADFVSTGNGPLKLEVVYSLWAKDGWVDGCFDPISLRFGGRGSLPFNFTAGGQGEVIFAKTQ